MEPKETLYEVIRHVRPLHRVLANAVQDRLVGTGVTVGMRAVMERLYEGGPQTVPQIGRTLFLKRQVVQRTVNALLELGLVWRKDNPAHRSSPLIELTSKGRDEFGRIRERESAVLEVVAEEFTSEDLEACLRVLARLAGQFQEINEENRRDGGRGERPLPAVEEFVD